jgi:integrase
MWAVLEEAYDDARNRDTRLRVTSTWAEFLRLNNFSPSARALKLFIGQMIGLGLKIGSVHTYVRYIGKSCAPRFGPEAGEWCRTINLVCLAHADAETRKAPSITVDEAMMIISRLYGDVGFVVAGIVTTGARCSDIMRWMPSRLLFEENRFVVDVHVTKNRREPDKRTVHRVGDVKAMLGFTVPPVLQSVRNYPPLNRPFVGWHTTRVNQALNAACKDLGLPRCTTYSFRRLYCQRILQYCNYDANTAKKYTLHCRAEVLAAFYDDARQ